MRIHYQTITLILVYTKQSFAVGNDGVGGLSYITDTIIPIIIAILIIIMIFIIWKGITHIKKYIGTNAKEVFIHSKEPDYNLSLDSTSWVIDKNKILESIKSGDSLDKDYAIDLLQRYVDIKNTEAKIILEEKYK